MMRYALLPALLGSMLTLSAATPNAPTVDVVIRGGMVLDGSGRPMFQGDVAVDGGRIVAVGDVGRVSARHTIDARGRYVAPGFISIHSHARANAVATAANMLTQGVTSEFIDADGQGTDDLPGQMRDYAAHGLAVNIGGMAGFNAAWEKVAGTKDHRPSAAEIQAMQGIVKRNMEQGAWGVSGGLDYKPGYYATADEAARVMSVAARWRTHFTNHDRLRPEQDYSSRQGVAETIAVAEQAKLFPNVTHAKSQGAEQGGAGVIVDMLRTATARGFPGTTDVYPYLAGQTGMGALTIPGWALDGGREAMLARFRTPTLRGRIIAEAERAMRLRFGGPQGVVDAETHTPLPDYMKRWNVGAGEALVRLLEEKDRAAVLFFGSEDDLVTFMKYEGSAISCDCGAFLGPQTHPRYVGSFPRVLGRYTRERKLFGFEEAIRRMTSLPAQIVGAVDRGLIAPGMMADVTIFDPATVQDRATYEQPGTFSVGITHVLVNGVLALNQGTPTGRQGGRTLLRSSHMPSRPFQPIGAGGLSVESALGAGWSVKADLSQSPAQRQARGTLTVSSPDGNWTATQLGLLQKTRDWMSISAVLAGASGERRAAVLIADGFDPVSQRAGTVQLLWRDQVLEGTARRLHMR